MSEQESKIPEKFYKSPEEKIGQVKTLGALKKLLAELPDSMPLQMGSGCGIIPMVFNHGQATMHLSFEEADDWIDDDDFDDDLSIDLDDEDDEDEEE